MAHHRRDNHNHHSLKSIKFDSNQCKTTLLQKSSQKVALMNNYPNLNDEYT